jgi:hypothetical protein
LWQAEQVPAKIWDGLLPASRFCACTGIAAKQPIRSVTVASLSARLNIHNSPDAEITSSALRFDDGGGGHLLADYAANGSEHMVQGRECDLFKYPLCEQCTSAQTPALICSL